MSKKEVTIDEFKIEDIPLSCTWIIIGNPGSGKSTLIENLCYYLKHRYPVARLFIGTPEGFQKSCEIFHPLYVSNSYNEDQEKQHIVRQKTCAMENGKTDISSYSINIMDDVSDDPQIYRTKVMRGLFKLGSQHWNQLYIVGSQYAIEMPPDVRKSLRMLLYFASPKKLKEKNYTQILVV